MFRNIIKTAFRSLLKNKGFAFLNVLGLALGLATCMLIIFYVVDELSFDKYNIKADRIFRVNTDVKSGPNASTNAIAAPAVAPALMNNFPEVEKVVRLLPDQELVKKADDFVLESKVVYSDPTIFDIFTLPMIEGNPANALKEPNSLVLTESIAKKYFNSTHVVGQSLVFFGDNTIHKITGVIHNIPKQSHFQFDFFLPMAIVSLSRDDHFNDLYPFSTYVLLKPGANYKSFEAKFPALIRKNLDFIDEMEKNRDYLRINLTPLKDIHLQSNRINELGRNGNILYVRIFTATALLILLIACINFMNLATARSSDRAREVGVRKVLGSSRKYLIAQFLSESFIVTLAASTIAVFGAWLLLPLFNQISGKNLALTSQDLKWQLPSLLLIVVVVGLVASSYPAFYLSAFRPIDVLKGRLSAGFKADGIRSILVVFQFSISILLITSALVMYNQLHFIQNKDLGFNRKQVLIVKNMNSLQSNQAKVLKQEMKQLPGVLEATLSSFLPIGNRRWMNFASSYTGVLQTQFWPVDEDYLNMMGMTLVKGRSFSNQFTTDSSSMIINETAAKMLGIKDGPLNQAVSIAQKKFNIIGIVKDFNFSSLRDNVTPVMMVMMTPFMTKVEGDGPDNLCIRVNTDNISALLAYVKNKWKSFSPAQQFEYSFMDEDFDAIYQQEQRMAKLFVVFATLAIIIACLGLFGLSAYAAEQRNKEISIRKILGAEIITIVAMLSKDFMKLVIISILISTPLAWLAMQKWLQDFAYRVNIHWWILAIASITAILIAFITISFQSTKAANANPINSLRSE